MADVDLVILDDEQNILNSLTRLFKDEPFEIYTTTNYSDALEAVGSGKAKLVLSDHRMPDISGTDFLKMVKEKYPNVVRMLFTGYTDIHIAEEAINKGEVFRFINKPWDDKNLKATIKEAIANFDLAEQNRNLTAQTKRQNEELIGLNAKLEEMYKAQKDFSSTVSHELRTPLASIKTIIDVVMSETAGKLTDEQKNFLNKAKLNVDRLTRLINDVLSLAKLESGKAVLNIVATDINALINEVIEVQSPVAEKKGLYLKADLAHNVSKIFIDSDKINQVLNNLIGNAVKFTSEGGITVSSVINQEKNNVIIVVKDTGLGIKEEDKDKLFHKFQQLGDHATRETGGTGLGLAICKEIIGKHRGKIWVESEIDKGSRFCFLLPINERRENE